MVFVLFFHFSINSNIEILIDNNQKDCTNDKSCTISTVINNRLKYAWGWMESTTFRGYEGINYYQDKAQRKGDKWIQYIPNILEADFYEIYERHPVSFKCNSKNVPHNIYHKNGIAYINVDQSVLGGRWNLLGVFEFNRGKKGLLKITNSKSTQATDGNLNAYVIADAIKWKKAPNDCNINNGGCDNTGSIQATCIDNDRSNENSGVICTCPFTYQENKKNQCTLDECTIKNGYCYQKGDVIATCKDTNLEESNNDVTCQCPLGYSPLGQQAPNTTCVYFDISSTPSISSKLVTTTMGSNISTPSSLSNTGTTTINRTGSIINTMTVQNHTTNNIVTSGNVLNNIDSESKKGLDYVGKVVLTIIGVVILIIIILSFVIYHIIKERKKKKTNSNNKRNDVEFSLLEDESTKPNEIKFVVTKNIFITNKLEIIPESIKTDTHKKLYNSDYQTTLKYILSKLVQSESPLFVFIYDKLIKVTDADKKKEISNSIVVVFQLTININEPSNDHILQNFIIEKELSNKNMPFRSISVPSGMISYYINIIGREILKEALGDKINSICKSDSYDFEINPEHLKKSNILENWKMWKPKNAMNVCEILERNQNNLSKITVEILDKIIESVEKTPNRIKMCLATIYTSLQKMVTETKQNYSNDGDTNLKGNYFHIEAFSNLLFLRFWIPSISDPKKHDIIGENVKISERSQRTLSCIARLLQKLANFQVFKSWDTSKKNVFEPMNDKFLTEENKEKIRNYYNKIIQEKDIKHDKKDIIIPKNIENNARKTIFKFLIEHEIEIKTKLFYEDDKNEYDMIFNTQIPSIDEKKNK